MSKKLFKTVTPIATLALISGSSLLAAYAVAQDIEFMGKNGERVELTPKIEALPGDQPAAEIPAVERSAKPGIRMGGMGNFGDLRGRTFTVTDSDGETKEISTDDAKSIVVNRSFSSVTENGQQKIKQGATAIIVAADGQRYEVDLSTINDDELKGEAVETAEAKPVEVKKSYMIGVFCESVPEMMRSQLNLDEGVGLLVQRVQEGSPAADAGVKKFDILMYADDKTLSDVNELTGVVTEAGKQEQAFTLTVMRGGEELPIEVTPSEREMAAGFPGRMPMGGFEMNDMGPGLIFDKGLDGDMMQQMQNHMKQVREEMMRMDNLLQGEGLPMPGMPKEIFPEQGQPADDVR